MLAPVTETFVITIMAYSATRRPMGPAYPEKNHERLWDMNQQLSTPLGRHVAVSGALYAAGSPIGGNLSDDGRVMGGGQEKACGQRRNRNKVVWIFCNVFQL